VVSTPAAVLDRQTALAFHEAGHAVVDHANGVEVMRVWIGDVGGRPEGRAHASARGAVAEAVLDGENPDAVRPIVQGAVAGILAEARVTAAPLWADAYADLFLAKQLMDGAHPTEEETARFLDVCIEGANRILTERWPSVVTIANVLHARGEIDGSELESLLAGRAPIPTRSAS
jgi:hypothetical protein